MCGKNNAGTAVHSGKFFHGYRITYYIKPCSTIFLRIRNSHQAHFTQLLYSFIRKTVFLVQGKGYGSDLLFGKGADLCTQLLMFCSCLK